MKLSKNNLCLTIILLLFSIVSVGCRGWRTKNEPFHINPNMDWQSKFKAQTLSLKPVENAVVWGNEASFTQPAKRNDYIQQDTAYYFGKTSYGTWVRKAPVKVSKELVLKGKEQYGIHCAVCHNKVGTGVDAKGENAIVKAGYTQPTNLSDERIVNHTDGELYDVITNGRRSMWGYGKRIKPEDRWAIVTYIRAIQATRTRKLNALPKNIRNEIKNKLNNKNGELN